MAQGGSKLQKSEFELVSRSGVWAIANGSPLRLLKKSYAVHAVGACNGQVGLQLWEDALVNSAPFDLVLMDLHMPLMSGVRVGSEICTLQGRNSLNIGYSEDLL